MSRRALLIGSQTGGLTGVHADVDLMRMTLEALQFETQTVTEAQATREGILSAYRGLVDAAQDADAVLVYYSGHGARYRNPLAVNDPEAPRYLQFIIPTDFDDAPGDEFRGVLAEEMSLLQAELTRKTPNVTTVLDCCHSARMSRDPSRLPRARETRGISFDAIRATYEAARNAPGVDRIETDSNPLAVRVVACAPDQSAYELNLPDGSRHGALTATFANLLGDQSASRLTWRQLLEGLRPAVMDLVEFQRPEIEGPTDRYLFTTEERSSTAVLPVIIDAGTPYLVAPSLFGVGEGDTYALVVAGEGPEAPLATAVVDHVQDGRARLAVREGGLGPRTSGIEAHPVRVALGRRPVAVSPPGDPDAQRVAAVLGESPHVRVVEPGALGLLATVEVGDGGMRLLDAAGEPLQDVARSVDDSSLRSLGRDVLQLARAAHLRDLPSGEGGAALPDDVTVEYVRLTDEGESLLEASGQHLFDGDRIVVRLRNNGEKQRFASVFDVGLRGAITLLSTSEPAGLTLAPGDVHELYRGPAGLTGMELYWPDDLPRTAPRPESIVTVITDRRQDLTRLHQPGVSRAREESPSPLEQLVDAVATGTRDARPPSPREETVRYRVARFDFVLNPEKRVDDQEPEFEIDERPDLSFRLVVPRTQAVAPDHVAVRLTEVVVHSNRAILRSTVRIDSMVLTRLEAQSAASPYQAATVRFDRVRDGDRLPLDNFLIYEGPVSGFLDIAVWVARDDQREVDLAELLQRETGRDDVKAALATLMGLAVAAPQAAVAVAAVAAVATLVRTGAALLDAAVGKSIGVYRTSLLPHERFGAGDPVGRHPQSGLLRAQDMSFAFEVVGSSAQPGPPAT
jgi:Caspase domain